MIQVYSENNTNYIKNGDIVLMPSECIISVQLGGEWSCSLIHPIDEGGRWTFLSEEAVVKMPSYNGDQLFRIRTRNKTDYEVTCRLEPIFFDSMQDNFLVDVRPTDKTGQQALNIMINNPKYSGVSNISKINTAYYEYKNLMEALQGSDDNAFISRWGAELEFDNFTVKAMQRIGADNGVAVRYGRNMQSIEETVDMTGVVTRVYPVGYNGRRHTSYVDSPLKSNYPMIKTESRQYPHIVLAEDATGDMSDNPDYIICQTQTALNTALASAVRAEFNAGLDKPLVTLDIKMYDLRNAEEYADYKDLETVSLGDMVYAYHSRLDIESIERVVALKYNAITDSIEEITLGAFQYDFFNDISGSMSKLISTSRTIEGVAEIAEAAQNTANNASQAIEENSQYFYSSASGTNIDSDTQINLSAPSVNINGDEIKSMAFEDAAAWNNYKIGSVSFSQTAADTYTLNISGVVFAALISATNYITGLSYIVDGCVLHFDSAITDGTIRYLYLEET